MRNKSGSYRIFLLLLVLALAAFPSASASATHAWGNYHWARTSNPFTITVIDSMTPEWDGKLSKANNDWNQSSVMDNVLTTGADDAATRSRCRPVKGQVRSCNYTYGINGWLGLAQIWVRGSHITQGVAKMNDSYLASPVYGYTETNRQHVMCQEIGHDWGLGHQSESGADLNTCMDYDDALGNPSPNAHDYQQLEIIYEHLDGSTTIGAVPNGFENADVHAQQNWGEKVSDNGKTALFVRDFGSGFKIFTFVTWAPE